MKLSSFEREGIRLGVVRGISYGLFGPPGEFVPQARALGAGLVRAYLFWSQVEPEPGHYRWDTVDALLGQLSGDEELWITLCSSSPWGTRQPTDFLPPSPALDERAYAEFVREVVLHRVDRVGGGRVRYWQCDNEPSNTDLLWAGTAEEYAGQLQTMYRAVKAADPAAAVVLGGCGYDVFSGEPDSAPRQFFDHVAKALPRRLRPVQCAPLRRPRPGARVPGHRQAVHAGARIPEACRGRRARRAAAVRVW